MRISIFGETPDSTGRYSFKCSLMVISKGEAPSCIIVF